MKLKHSAAPPKFFLLGALLLIVAAARADAQETFKLRRASTKYEVTLRVAACGGPEQDNMPNTCSGAGRVSLFRKGAKTPFQVLSLPNIEIYKDSVAYNPKLNEKPRMIYDEEYGVVFEDFDFDGEEDLAICNGRNSGYGGPSYNIYLFDKTARRFVANRRLTRLNEGGYLGLFSRDMKRKLLVVYSKSGCCYHETEMYRVIGGRPTLVEKIFEDATVTDDAGERFVVTTTRKKVGGRWVEKSRKEKIKEEQE